MRAPAPTIVSFSTEPSTLAPFSIVTLGPMEPRFTTAPSSTRTGSITRTDGTAQLTVDGWPVYRFAKDTAPGQVNGQGVKDAWYVLLPDGTMNKEAAAMSTATPAP